MGSNHCNRCCASSIHISWPSSHEVAMSTSQQAEACCVDQARPCRVLPSAVRKRNVHATAKKQVSPCAGSIQKAVRDRGTIEPCLDKLRSPQIEHELRKVFQLWLQTKRGGIILSVIPKPSSQSANNQNTNYSMYLIRQYKVCFHTVIRAYCSKHT